MISIKKLFIMLIMLSIYTTSIVVAGDPGSNVSGNATPTDTATKTTTPVVTGANVTVTQVPTTVATTVGEGKFRVGPSITLRPVTEVIETNQDGVVEFFMNNPSLNDVTLNVDARISVPSGIHIYGESFSQSAGAGVVAGTFSVPPGKSRVITVVVKADKSARIGSHTISFTGLYWPNEDKDSFQPLSLTYSVTVNEPSKDPLKDTSGDFKSEKTEKSPGMTAVLAIFVIVILVYGLRRT